jgi:hypothetical protein
MVGSVAQRPRLLHGDLGRLCPVVARHLLEPRVQQRLLRSYALGRVVVEHLLKQVDKVFEKTVRRWDDVLD